jgi:hypothetical protein
MRRIVEVKLGRPSHGMGDAEYLETALELKAEQDKLRETLYIEDHIIRLSEAELFRCSKIYRLS